MPINLIIYAAIAIAIYGGGYWTAYNHEHKAVIELQASIELANKVSAQKLAEIVNTVKTETAKQKETITQLEAQHEQVKNDNDSLASQLATAQLQHSTNDKPRGCITLPKVSNPSSSKGNVGARQAIPATNAVSGLDQLVQKTVAKAVQDDADKHYLLQWIGSLPADLIGGD